MAFSSNFFLFAFLPTVLALHYAAPIAYRNHVLLAASLTFYAFDTGWLAYQSMFPQLIAGPIVR
jgi:hypothetical protein